MLMFFYVPVSISSSYCMFLYLGCLWLGFRVACLSSKDIIRDHFVLPELSITLHLLQGAEFICCTCSNEMAQTHAADH